MRRPKCCSLPSTVVRRHQVRPRSGLLCPAVQGLQQPTPSPAGRLTLMVGPRLSGGTLHHQIRAPTPTHSTSHSRPHPTPYTLHLTPNHLHNSTLHSVQLLTPYNSQLSSHNSHPDIPRHATTVTVSFSTSPSVTHTTHHPSHVCSRSRVRALGPPARRSWG
jgi:hypothetical protein